MAVKIETFKDSGNSWLSDDEYPRRIMSCDEYKVCADMESRGWRRVGEQFLRDRHVQVWARGGNNGM